MMMWTMGLRQRIKSAMLLMVVFGAILVSNLWERNNISDLNESFSSIYEDRLLPATYIFHLTDRLYKKRIVLEDMLAEKNNRTFEEARAEINSHNAAIDTLLTTFEATYLVEKESESLKRFTTAYQDYNREEEAILESLVTCNNSTGEHQGNLLSSFSRTKKELTELSQIQTSVGKDLTTGSQSTFANFNLMTTVEIALIVVVCLIIEILVLGTKEMRPNPKGYKLN